MRKERLDRWFGTVPELPAPEGLDADRRAQWALWSAAILMVLLNFRAGVELGDLNPEWAGFHEYSFAGRIYWVIWGVIAYLLAPLAIVAFVFRESPARYGLRIHFTRQMVHI